jgi:hypothetical protein
MTVSGSMGYLYLVTFLGEKNLCLIDFSGEMD